MMVTPRDIVVAGRTTVLPDGSLFLYSSSVTHPDAPEQPGHVRTNLVFGALRITPRGANKCFVSAGSAAAAPGSPQRGRCVSGVLRGWC